MGKRKPKGLENPIKAKVPKESAEESIESSAEGNEAPFFAPKDDSLYPYHGDKIALTSYSHEFVERKEWTDEEHTFVSFTEGRTGRIIRCWENMIEKVGFTHNIQEFYMECAKKFPEMKNSDDVLWTETEMKILNRHTRGDFYPRWAIFEDLLRYGSTKSWYECDRKFALKLQNHLHLELTQENVSDVQALMSKYSGDISRVAAELKLNETAVQEWYEGLELHSDEPHYIAKEDRIYNSNVSLGTPGVSKRTVGERRQQETNWFESEDLALLQSIRKVGVKNFDHEEFQKKLPGKTAKQRKKRYSTLSATGTFGENLQDMESGLDAEDLSMNMPQKYRDSSVAWTQAENKAFFSLLALYASNKDESPEWDTISFYVASRSPVDCKKHFQHLKSLWLNM